MVEQIEDGNTCLHDHLVDGVSCLDAQVLASKLYETRKTLWKCCQRFLDLHMKDCPADKGSSIPVLIPGVEETDTENFNEVISIRADDFEELFVVRQPTLVSPNQMTGLDSLFKESNSIIKEANLLATTKSDTELLENKAEIVHKHIADVLASTIPTKVNTLYATKHALTSLEEIQKEIRNAEVQKVPVEDEKKALVAGRISLLVDQLEQLEH